MAAQKPARFLHMARLCCLAMETWNPHPRCAVPAIFGRTLVLPGEIGDGGDAGPPQWPPPCFAKPVTTRDASGPLRSKATDVDGDSWVDAGGWARSTCRPSRHPSHWLGWFPLRMTVGSLFLDWQGCWLFPRRALQHLQGTGGLAPFSTKLGRTGPLTWGLRVLRVPLPSLFRGYLARAAPGWTICGPNAEDSLTASRGRLVPPAWPVIAPCLRLGRGKQQPGMATGPARTHAPTSPRPLPLGLQKIGIP